MTFLTGTNWEQIYVNDASSTAKNTFNTEGQLNDIAAMGPMPYLPLGFFLGRSKTALRVVARGLVSTYVTGSVTYTFNLRTTTANTGWTSGGTILLGGAVTVGLNTGNGIWEFEGDVTVGDPAGSSATPFRGTGMVSSSGASNAFVGAAWGAGSQPGTSTFDPTAAYWLALTANCSVSNASNSVQLIHFEIQGK